MPDVYDIITSEIEPEDDAPPEGWSVYWFGGEEFEAPTRNAAFRAHQVLRFAGLFD